MRDIQSTLACENRLLSLQNGGLKLFLQDSVSLHLPLDVSQSSLTQLLQLSAQSNPNFDFWQAVWKF
jgi:hypothetical protein